MANEQVNRYLNVYIQSGEAQKALDALIAKETKLKDELSKATDPKQLERLNAEIKKLQEPIDRATRKVKGELAPSIKETEVLVSKLGKRLKRMSRDDADYSEILKQYGQARILLQQMKGGIDEIAVAQKSLSKESFIGSFFGNIGANLVSRAGSFLTDIFGGSREEFEQADLAIRNLQTSLQNFGDVDALPKLTQQADDLAKKFKFLDNDDIVIAQDKLVTYGKLTTAEIMKLIPVIVDFAAKTRQDIPSATETFIKALEGQGRGIKGYQAEVKATNTVSENFSQLTTKLANAVRGAADTFGDSATGKIARFRQAINNIKEDVGAFINSLIEGPKTAVKLFEEAETTTKQLNATLDPLLEKYDELKSKTSLNKEEQALLQGVINEIIRIVPQAATEFDKYGNALDINKAKVLDFRKENDKFLQTRNRDAIRELQDEAKGLADKILLATNNINGAIKDAEMWGGGLEKVSNFIAQAKTTITVSQEKLIQVNEKLNNQFKTELPASLKKYLDEAQEAKYAADLTTNITTVESDADRNARLQREKEDAEKKKKEDEELKKKSEQAAKEAAAARKRAEEEYKRLLDDIQKNKQRVSLAGLTGLEKELSEQDIKYAELRQRAAGHNDLLIQLQTTFQEERLLIIQRYVDKERSAIEKANDKSIKKSDESFKKIIDHLKKMSKEIAEQSDAFSVASNENRDRERLASAQLDFIKSTGRKKLNAELVLLKEQERQELEQTGATGKQKELIEEEYRRRRREAELNYWVETVNLISNFASQALEIGRMFGDANTQRENAELERDRQNNERKKNHLERRLKAGMVTQLQYDRELMKMEKEQQKRQHQVDVKQFKRKQRESIVQALINGAQGVTRAIAEYPFPFNLIPIAFATATTAAQIIAIGKQKPPEAFGKGGKLIGPAHSDASRGMPVTNPYTGRVYAYLEGDEGIINKRSMRDRTRYSVSGTTSQIASFLNSKHGVNWESGARWMNAKQTPINTPVIRKYYADGGKFKSSSETQNAQSNANAKDEVLERMIMTLDGMQVTLNSMNATLAAGITAYPVLTDMEKQQDRLNAIRRDATLKP